MRLSRWRRASASRMRSGVIGSSVMRNPTASATALVTAGRKSGERSLARFLGAEGTVGIEAFDDMHLDRRGLHHRRDGIAKQARMQRQAALVASLFAQGLSHAHPYRALDLPLDRERVDGAPAIMRDPYLLDADHAGVGIDLDLDGCVGVNAQIMDCSLAADGSVAVDTDQPWQL